MPRARRAACIFFRLSEDLLPDIERLLQGEAKVASQTRLLAVSVLTGRERVVSLEEVRLLRDLGTDRWTPVDELDLDTDALQRLADDGLVLLDTKTPALDRLRRRDSRLRDGGWDPYAALYHSQSTWQDVDVGGLEVSPPLRKPPPAFFAAAETSASLDLPVIRRDDGLFGRLLERRTTRRFDPERPLSHSDLSVLLYYTFGCHGVSRVEEEIALLRKTSPSGGSLHPIEAYALIADVDGVAPGLYHYRVDRHALDLLEALDAAEARQKAFLYTAGQTYLTSAKLLLILAARFERSFWKYRSNARALAVLFMDAAHLSQTLYLVCAELGLGAFVSAAVNSGNIEGDLGLDNLEQGVLAVCGCGTPTAERSPYDTPFEPYVPRVTEL